MDVGSSFVAGAESFELVQPGESAFYDPSDGAESGAVVGVAAGDARDDSSISQGFAVVVVGSP